jgi:uncharacterized protein
LFGYLLVWSGSLWVPVIAHFINNGFAVVAMYFINQKKLNPAIEEIGTTADSYYFTVLSLVFVVVLLVWLKKINRENSLKPEELLS